MQALYDISAFGLLPLGASIMQSPRENASPCVKLDPVMHIPIGGELVMHALSVNTCSRMVTHVVHC